MAEEILVNNPGGIIWEDILNIAPEKDTLLSKFIIHLRDSGNRIPIGYMQHIVNRFQEEDTGISTVGKLRNYFNHLLAKEKLPYKVKILRSKGHALVERTDKKKATQQQPNFTPRISKLTKKEISEMKASIRRGLKSCKKLGCVVKTGDCDRGCTFEQALRALS